MKPAVDLRRGGGHLPPGHRPGVQTRRGARAATIAMTVISVLAVGFFGGAIALLVIAGDIKAGSGARVGGALLIVGALAMVVLLVYMRRRLRPRQALHLLLDVTPRECARGQTVTATLVMRNPRSTGEELQLGLVCTEYYDVRKDVTGEGAQRVTAPIDMFTDWREADRRQPQQMVSFTVPTEAPFSYEGATVSWAWHVSAIDRRGRRRDACRDVAIWVRP